MFGYSIERELGRGIQGRVLSAYSWHENRVFAVKQVSIRTFNQELVDLLIDMRHPHIVRFYEYELKGNFAYLKMEQINGESLFELIQKNTLDSNRVHKFMLQIYQSLKHLHALNIVYRDLKPENIMIDHSDNAIMIDFEMSKILTQDTFTFCGTPIYMAPEQITGEGYSVSVDYWEFGILLYEMLFGEVPFTGEIPLEIYQAILTTDPEIPKQIDEQNHILNRIFLQVLNTCLIKDPRIRLKEVKKLDKLLMSGIS